MPLRWRQSSRNNKMCCRWIWLTNRDSTSASTDISMRRSWHGKRSASSNSSILLTLLTAVSLCTTNLVGLSQANNLQQHQEHQQHEATMLYQQQQQQPHKENAVEVKELITASSDTMSTTIEEAAAVVAVTTTEKTEKAAFAAAAAAAAAVAATATQIKPTKMARTTSTATATANREAVKIISTAATTDATTTAKINSTMLKNSSSTAMSMSVSTTTMPVVVKALRLSTSTFESTATTTVGIIEYLGLQPLQQQQQQQQQLHTDAESLTKGFSIPTFLPPYPVFAAADLEAHYSNATTEPASLSTDYQQQQEQQQEQQQHQQSTMLNEQHSHFHAYNSDAKTGNGNKNRDNNAALQSEQNSRRNLSLSLLNVTVQMGNHAYMPCQIRRLADKPVSWVRMRDEHIISVDETTFIADERFQALYQASNNYSWSLQIKYVQAADAGWYECQMATEPKQSAKVYLNVVTPTTELIGDHNRFVKAGSKVELHCIVRGTLEAPNYIIWFRGKTQVSENDADPNGGWYTQIDRNIFGNVADNRNTIGSLIIPIVRKTHSGNYTCQPSNSASVSVYLHVLSGEYSASAIMSGSAGLINNSIFNTYILLLIFLLVALQKT